MYKVSIKKSLVRIQPPFDHWDCIFIVSELGVTYYPFSRKLWIKIKAVPDN